MIKKNYQYVEETNPDEANHRLRLAQAVNDATRGNIDCVKDTTLEAGSTQHTVVDNRIGWYSAVIITTLDNAGYLIRSTIRETARGKGFVTFQYSAPATDARLRLVIIG